MTNNIILCVDTSVGLLLLLLLMFVTVAVDANNFMCIQKPTTNRCTNLSNKAKCNF